MTDPTPPPGVSWRPLRVPRPRGRDLGDLLPGQRLPLHVQVDKHARDARGDGPKYAILALAPSRTTIVSLRVNGDEDDRIERFGSFLWAIPVEFFEGEPDPEIEGHMAAESSEVFGIADVVTEQDFPRLVADGGDDGDPNAPPGRAEPPSETYEESNWVDPGLVIKNGANFILANCIWLLEKRLSQATLLGSGELIRHQFLGFDLLTNANLLAQATAFASPKLVLDAVEAELTALGLDGAAWRAGAHPRLMTILQWFAPPSDARHLILPVQATLWDTIVKRFDNTTGAGYPAPGPDWSLTAQAYGITSTKPFQQAVEELWDYVEEVISLFGLPMGMMAVNPDSGLAIPFDLPQFAMGSVNMNQIDYSHALFNVEADSLLFASFAEFFLIRAGFAGSAKQIAWAQLAIAAEKCYVESYQPDTNTPLSTPNYHYSLGPIPGRAGWGYMLQAVGQVWGLGTNLTVLEQLHHAILNAAKGPRATVSLP